MKKRFSMFVTLLLSVAMIVTALPVDAFAGEISLDKDEEVVSLLAKDEDISLAEDEIIPEEDDEITLAGDLSGDCSKTTSDHVTWELEEIEGDPSSYCLKISGTGEMADYDSDGSVDTFSPWRAALSALEIDSAAIVVIQISEGVTGIGKYAFCATGVSEVEIPVSVTSIGQGAFYGCYCLVDITFHRITADVEIGDEAFYGVADRGYVNIHGWFDDYIPVLANGDLYIAQDEWDFGWNICQESLVDGRCEASGEGDGWIIWSIFPADGFQYGTNEKYFLSTTAQGGNTYYMKNYSDTASTAPWATVSDGKYKDKISEVLIDTQIKRIGTGAFYGMGGLEKVTIPSAVQYIGNKVFANCSSLKKIYFESNNPSGIAFSNYAFSDLPSTGGIIKVSSDAIDGYCTSITAAGGSNVGKEGDGKPWVVTDAHEHIWQYVYGGEGCIKAICNANPTKPAEQCQYYGYNNGLNITIKADDAYACDITAENPYKATVSYDEDVLSDLVYTLEYEGINVNYAKSATAPSAPGKYSAILTISMGGSPVSVSDDFTIIDAIAHGSYGDNISWTVIKVDNNNYTLEVSGSGEIPDSSDDDFGPWNKSDDYSSKITKLVVGKDITSIGPCNFSSMAGLKDVVFEEGTKLTAINHHAFDNCAVLEEIVIPEGVTLIDRYAFQYCPNLKSAVFPSSIERIGYAPFYCCNSFEKLTINQPDPSKITFEGELFLIDYSDEDGRYTAANGTVYVAGNVGTDKNDTSGYWYYLTHYGTHNTNLGVGKKPGTNMDYPWQIVLMENPHDHTWNYQFDENKPNQVKAYCSTVNPDDAEDKCDYYWDGQTAGFTNYAVITLDADDAYVSDLDAEHPYAPKLTDAAGVVAAPSYTYEKSDGTAVNGIPSEAGAYKVSLTIGEGNDAVTISDTFSIKDAIAHGDCSAEGEGNDVKWEIVKGEDFTEDNEVYTLHVFGEGKIADYGFTSSSEAPWLSVKDAADNKICVSQVTKLILSGNITYIGQFNTWCMGGLKEVDFDDNEDLDTIGSAAFSCCGIETIKIPASVTTLSPACFTACSNLKSIEFEQVDSSNITFEGPIVTDITVTGIEDLSFETFYVPVACTAEQVEAYQTKLIAAYSADSVVNKPEIVISQEPVAGKWNIAKHLPPHDHTWNYKFDKNTPNQFKAYCSAVDPENPDNKCDYYWNGKTGAGPAKWAVVSLEAADTYSCDLDAEHPYEPVLTDAAGVVAAPSYTYEKLDGTAVNGVPSEAGDYKVSLTVGEGKNAVTISDTFTIKDAVVHGDCSAEGEGNDVKWEIVKGEDFTEDYEVYTLNISGKGKIGYDSDYAPWYVSELSLQYLEQVTKIVVTGSVENLPDYSFAEMMLVTDLDISGNEGLTYIGDYALASLSITSIVIPETVTYIGENSFLACSLLKSIEFEQKDPSQITFGKNFLINMRMEDHIITGDGLAFETFYIPQDANGDAYKTEIMKAYTGDDPIFTPKIEVSQEHENGKWNIANNYNDPVPVKEVKLNTPAGGFVFNPKGDETFDEFVAKIKVTATLMNGKEEDITEYCSFDTQDVNPIVLGTYPITVYFVRKDSTGVIFKKELKDYILVDDGETSKITVSYVPGTAKYGTVPLAATADAGNEIEIAGNTGNLAIDGYEFKCWQDDDGTEYQPGQKVNESLVLVPVFTEKSYRVSASAFTAGNGIEVKVDGDVTELKYKAEGKIIVTAPKDDTSDTGSIFAQEFYGVDDTIFTSPDPVKETEGETVKYTYTFKMPMNDVDFKALARTAITLNANVAGGKFNPGNADDETKKTIYISEVADQEIFTTEFPVPEHPEGYEFLGWFGEKECETQFNGIIFFNEDTDVYAGWAFKATEGKMLVMAIPDQTYTGSKITPTVVVTDGEKELINGVDYTVTYKNNTDANKNGQYIKTNNLIVQADNVDEEPVNPALPYVIIKGKGNYGGQTCMNFNILRASIEGDHLDADGNADSFAPEFDVYFTSSLVENAKKKQKTDTLIAYAPNDFGKTLNLKLGKDYTVSYCYKLAGTQGYSYPMDAIPAGGRGTFKIVFTGIGNYTGEVCKDIEVHGEDNYLGKAAVSVKSAVFTKAWDPVGEKWDDTIDVTIKSIKIGKNDVPEDKYTAEFIDGAPACPGTYCLRISPKDETYTGYKDVKVVVKAANTKGLDIVVNETHDYIGEEDEYPLQKVVDKNLVKPDGSIYELRENVDYRYSYISKKSIWDAGSVKVEVQGLGIYTGYKKSKTVKINPYDIDKDPTLLVSVNVSNEAALYNPKGAEPDVKVWFGDKLLTEGQDYTLAYKNNKSVAPKNPPTVTVKGKGNFKGTIKDAGTFKIIAKPFTAENIAITASDIIYKANKPAAIKFTVLDAENDAKLSAGKDYEKTYTYKVNGVYDLGDTVPVCGRDCQIGDFIEVTVTAKDNYRGKMTFITAVCGKAIKSTKLLKPIDNQVYDGTQIKPDKDDFVLTYKLASDDEAAYFNNDGGRKTVEKVGKQQQVSADVSLTLKKGDTIALDPDKDFYGDNLQYDTNLKVGTGKIAVIGNGFFADVTTLTFKIVPKPIKWLGQ